MYASLAGCAVQLIAIGRRMQAVEITKRASGAAQRDCGLLLTKNLAKRAILHDLAVTDQAFLRRAIRARPGVSLEVGSSHNNRLSTSATESRILRGHVARASGMLSE